MSGFDSVWLALREVADVRSRTAAWPSERRRRGEPLRVLDLATGTGSNLRYLAARIGGPQEWLLADIDQRLLDAVPGAMTAWAENLGYRLVREGAWFAVSGTGFSCRFRPLQVDLATLPEDLPIEQRDLVTASALLDLVSEPWVDDLVERCRRGGTDVLFALSYDGRIGMDPVLDDDALVIDLVNRHQRGDKGFGPAMGPAAPEITREKLLAEGYGVSTLASDWQLDRRETRLQAALIRGWTEAAMEIEPEAHDRLVAWHTERIELLRKGESRLVVGHQDLLGLHSRGGTSSRAF